MTSPTLARKAKLKNHLVSAKAKLRQLVTLRRILLASAASAAALLLLLTLRTLSASHARSPPGAAASSTNSPPVAAARRNTQQQHGGCSKLPEPVAEALVHYATANATLRQTAAEVVLTARLLARRAPCNLLVLGGLGPDSALWAALNHGGRTAFFEEDAALIAEVGARHPGLGLESHQVAYQTTLADADADELLALRGSPDCTASPPKDRPLSPDHFEGSPCKLAVRGLPAAFYETEWDVIMVDAPTGWVPGRTGGAIYMAGMAARARRPGSGETDVMVHNVERTVEDGLSRAFLCEGYIEEEVGRLRRFAIPSHREEKEGVPPFCP